jgi:two-component system response regulator WspF
MPVMDGAEATRRIMAASPCPILLVTSSVSSNFNHVYQAMGYGALDAVDTPVFGPGGSVLGGERLVARLHKLLPESQACLQVMPNVANASRLTVSPNCLLFPPIVAIGASTGGPQALATILGALPPHFGACMVVAQHIAAEFVPSLTKWLQGRCAVTVRPAEATSVPRAGEVVLAATDDHLVLRPDGRWGYTAQPVENPYRPSADVLFDSLAVVCPRPGVGVVLTGMGSDGGRGLLRLRQAGWRTIAQDRSTSVVYGMPKVASDLGAAERVLPLPAIGTALNDAVRELTHWDVR